MVNYHAASDTLDKVDIREVKLNTAIIAFGIAESPEKLGPRQSRAEIEAMLKQTGLGQQMQLVGIWSMWQNGNRGRQP
jgi:hypothetical protein